MKTLAIDPGEKNIGVAISDPTGVIARPLTVLKHVSREKDAAAIAQLADQEEAGMIIIGTSPDEEGNLTPQGRQAERLADSVRQQTTLEVILWDESFSTRDALQARIEMRTRRRKRRGHIDEMAATVILQSYLDARTGG